jgi:Ni,Fe-hydrogenase I cytochrome b subunit
VVHWLVTILIILYIATGLGITNYQIIEAVTFGGLSKLGVYQLHSTLLVPFLVVLAFHIGLTFMQNRQKRNINVA